MKKDEALSIIKQVAAAFVGNLKEHNAVQEAIATLETELNKDKK